MPSFLGDLPEACRHRAKAYEASSGRKSYKIDAEHVAFLFELYQNYTSLRPVALARKARPSRSR